MMAAKDARVKRTGELLQGIRTIKAAAWEPAFFARVRPVLLAVFVVSQGFTLCICFAHVVQCYAQCSVQYAPVIR